MFKRPKINTAKRQIFGILMPIMIGLSVATAVIAPPDFQLYYLSSILAISAAVSALIRSKFDGKIVINKLNKIIKLLEETPQVKSPSESTTKITTNKKRFKFLLKPILLIILLTIIVVQTIVIFNSDISKFFEADFYKEILLVLIPSMIGLITAKWVSNSWQQRKERNEIRKNTITEFTESFAKKYSMVGEFIGLLHNNYIDPALTIQNPNGTIKFVFKFPVNDAEKPFNKYAKEWELFKKEYWQLVYPSNKFLTSFRFYFDEKEIDTAIGISEEKMNSVFHMTSLFVYAKDLTEFKKWYSNMNTILDEVLPQLRIIEDGLISKKMIVR